MSTRAEITVTLPADVNQVDDTGFVWAFLSNAGEPERCSRERSSSPAIPWSRSWPG